MYILYRACGTFLYAPSIFRTDTDVHFFAMASVPLLPNIEKQRVSVIFS